MGRQILATQNKLLLTLAKYLVLVVLWFGSPPDIMAASVGCDDAFVQLADNEIVIDVAPTHSNDTDNIQCALDIAASAGFPVVRLKPATYFISLLIVEDFKGTFQGRTQTTTIIEVLDQSIKCEVMNDFGLHASAIKFVKGEPRIRFMTIRANKPCVTSKPLRTILHFTGAPTQIDNCRNEVIFAVVDRVTIERTSTDSKRVTGVAVYPEGRFLGGCQLTLLGTFKLNRSIISDTFFGIVTTMKAGAQVDINFNEFQGNQQAINLFDTNQNTTITTNKFFGDNKSDSNYIGVFVSNLRNDPPSSTRVVIHNNTFNISSSFPNQPSTAVFVSPSKPYPKVSTVVSNNKFQLSGTRTLAIQIENASNGHVSTNIFTGSGADAIVVTGTIPVSGLTITANQGFGGFNSSNGFDIVLGNNTSSSIVGAGQGASVLNKGTNNTVLAQ